MRKVTAEEDVQRIQYILFTLRVFEAELLVRLRRWDDLMKTVAVRSLVVRQYRISLVLIYT